MFRIRFWSVLLVFALLPFFAATPAHAALIGAVPGADVIANNGKCSLREAIINANNNNQSGSTDCPAGQANTTDLITLLAGETYTLTIFGSNTDINATEGDLDIINNLAALDLLIASTGTGRATIVFEQPDVQSNRVLDIRGGATVHLLRVKVAGGNSGNEDGGGIQNNGTLTLDDSEVADNYVPTDSKGGGIYTGPSSTLIIRDNSVVRDNRSLGEGGGI